MTRLNKAVAAATGIGRRKADDAIAAGRVAVDGTVVREPGCRLQAGAALAVDGRTVRWERQRDHLYFLYHKPRGVECTFDASQGGVIMHHRDDLSDWLARDPAIRYGGRLDAESEGLLLLSTDGTWLERTSHPSRGCVKQYEVLTKAMEIPLEDRKAGTVEIEELGPIQLGQWKPVRRHADGNLSWLVSLTQGTNRHIRRIAQHYGSDVIRLKRVHVGPFQLGKLPPGEATTLQPEEAWKRLQEYEAQQQGSRKP